MKLTMDTTSLDNAVALWGRRAAALPKVVQGEIEAIVEDALEPTRKATPRDTGNTAAAWTTTAKDGATLANPLRHAGFVAGGKLADVARAQIRKARKSRPPLTQTLQKEVADVG